MSIKLLTRPDKSLLPVKCTCQSCKAVFEVSDWSDFTHETLYSGMDGKSHDEIAVNCSVCGDLAFPPPSKKAALVSSYELWRKTTSGAPSWSRDFHCRHCGNTSKITISDVHVVNNAVGYAGENWDPEVCVVCPICHSSTPAGKTVPPGIQNDAISEAESKRR